MINREQKNVGIYKFLNIRDSYGQGRKLVKNSGTESMMIKFYSSVLQDNPGYQDIDFLALTTNRELGPENLISFDGHNYRIIYVVPSRRFNQLFIRETNEIFEEAHLDTPTGLYEIGEELTFILGCEPPVEKASKYNYEIFNLTTGQSVTYL